MNLISIKILWFCRSVNLEQGNLIPARPFLHQVIAKLNPKEKQDLDDSMEELVEQGLMEWRNNNGDLALTEEGFNLIYGPQFDEATKQGMAMVQNFNFHGNSNNIQIGNHNSQQIVGAIEMLAKAIDSADVPESEKKQAKGALASLLNNPTVVALIGPAVEAVKALVQSNS